MADEGEGTGIEVGGGDAGNTGVDPGPQLSPQGQQFISSIPEDHREIVGRYLPQWDAGFQKYAGGVNQQLKQYSELGEFDNIKQAVEFQQQFLNDPRSIVDWLFQNREDIEQLKDWQWNHQAPNPQEQAEKPPWLEHLNPVQEKVGQMEKVLALIAENLQSEQQSKAAAEADAALDRDIKQAQAKYGNFDIPTVLDIALSRRVSIDEAVQTFNGLAEQIMSQRAAKQAPITLGATSQPQLAKPATEMSGDERRQALAAFLGKMG